MLTFSLVFYHFTKKYNIKTLILANLTFLIQFFNNVTDLFGADVSSKQNRFTLVYRFLSSSAICFVIKTFNVENDIGKSLCLWIKSLKWLEHEYYDAFGINFDSKSSTQRLLLDYGFKGFPLRQDFPLSGFVELWFDWSQKIISDEQIALLQELTQDESTYELSIEPTFNNFSGVIDNLEITQKISSNMEHSLDFDFVINFLSCLNHKYNYFKTSDESIAINISFQHFYSFGGNVFAEGLEPNFLKELI